MISRRDFLQVSMAAAAIWGAGAPWARLAAQQKLTQDELLAFEPLGNVTLVHLTDIHAQLVPVYFREPSVNIGVGDAKGLPPHLTGDAFQQHFGIKAGSPEAYALTYNDFVSLANTYGRMGGIDRMTILTAVDQLAQGYIKLRVTARSAVKGLGVTLLAEGQVSFGGWSMQFRS